MSHKQINFQVRINDSASLREISLRVSQALNCSFTPSEAEEFEGDEALEAELFGLWITLSYSSNSLKGDIRNYRLVGDVPEDINHPWSDEVINISKYVLGLLTRRDKAGWYIPDDKELLAEAGLN